MGCTSSTPITADGQNDATDRAKMETYNENCAADVKVQNSDVIHKNHVNLDNHYSQEMVPNGYKTNENLQLPSYNSIFSNDTDRSAKDTDISINTETQENIVHTEEKLKTFIEVVDTVLVNNVVEDVKLEESQETEGEQNEVELESNSKIHECIPSDCKTPERLIEVLEKKDEAEGNLEHPESPAQSESRSTRWEALADIAAELPPSLAVDPVTGQIYSLTK